MLIVQVSGEADFAFPQKMSDDQDGKKSPAAAAAFIKVDCSLMMERTAFYIDRSNKESSFLASWDDGFMLAEIFFFLLLALLALFELYQAFVLRLQYLKELENLIEWVVILSAGVTIMTKQTMVDVTAENSAFVRGIAAIGIGAAWMELVNPIATIKKYKKPFFIQILLQALQYLFRFFNQGMILCI